MKIKKQAGGIATIIVIVVVACVVIGLLATSITPLKDSVSDTASTQTQQINKFNTAIQPANTD